MCKNILSIIIGYNYNDLIGSENDAILIYNIFYNYHLKKKFKHNFFKPKIYLNKDVKIKNIFNYLEEKIDTTDKVVFYFSGHSDLNKLFFYDEYLIKRDFFKYINNL